MALRRIALGILVAAACAASTPVADVISVRPYEHEHRLWLEVGISSPDTGCEQYANWWEVLSEEGELLFRRILTHSHVDEQPFLRSGGPIELERDQVVWVRAHMHPGGYGGQAFKGTIASGFEPADLAADFAAEAAEQEPLPQGCRF